MSRRVAEPGHVYFVGSHSSGKTTLAKWTAERYQLPLIYEVARTVLEERQVVGGLAALRLNPSLAGDYQREVFKRQIAAERLQGGRYVSDRAFDNLAYAGLHSDAYADLLAAPETAEYFEYCRKGVMFFVRPHRETISFDGVRPDADWNSMLRVDAVVQSLLEQYRLPYISIDSPDPLSRRRHVEAVMGLVGW